MTLRRLTTLTSLLALLSACGGGDSDGGTGTPSPTPTTTASGACSLRQRQDWAAAQLREWYLFPETLPASLDPGAYSSVEDYIDALTATARSQRKDRYFTFLTAIESEDAYYRQGTTVSFGIRLASDAAQRRVFVIEAFEGGAALTAGIDRGAEIVAIGTSSADLRTVADITASGGLSAVTAALGPDTAGTVRVLRISDANGIRNVSLTKSSFALAPVSSRYGAKVIDDGGAKIGYLNLRTFISTADPALRSAFASFRAQGITNVIVDLRYNGGGLVSIAELMGDLMGRDRSSSDVFSYTAYRPEKASSNETRTFSPQPESIAPTRIAFIGSGGTASASELVINAFIPYLDTRAGLIGADTYGKPVGQIAIDRSACNDRLRIVAFAKQNRDRQGDFYDGLATRIKASCIASDDISRPLGDPAEMMTRQALDFLAGRNCTPIGGTITTQSATRRSLITPDRPTTPQREVPGLF